MMLYGLIRPQKPGTVNCFDASKEPKLLLTQACNRPSHHNRPVKKTVLREPERVGEGRPDPVSIHMEHRDFEVAVMLQY